MKHVPNALTITRIVVTPLLLFLLFLDTLPGYFGGLVLFVAAAISDYFDGRLARKYNVGTSFGKYLDPLADKVLVLGTFTAFIFIRPDLVPVWTVAVIAARDVAVTALRTWARRRNRELQTSLAAKAKTTVQLTWLISMLTFLAGSRLPEPIGPILEELLDSTFMYWLLIFVVFVTVLTGIAYFRAYATGGLNAGVGDDPPRPESPGSTDPASG